MNLVSYLFFKDNAAEAFDFYARSLGGKVTMKVTMGEMPGNEALPAEARDLVAHVRLEVGDAVLMGSDWCGPTPEPYPGIHGNAVSLGVDEPGEAEHVFKALSEGGQVTMPIAETSWALRFRKRGRRKLSGSDLTYPVPVSVHYLGSAAATPHPSSQRQRTRQ